jgi:hypothetical protein
MTKKGDCECHVAMYINLECQPKSTVSLVSTKQARKLINHDKKCMLLIIKPRHFKKTVANSQLSIDQHPQLQHQQVDQVIEAYKDVFKDTIGVPLYHWVKYHIDLFPGSSLPNASIY